MTTQPRQILHFLADLASSRSPRRVYRVNTDTFRWLPLSYTKVLRGGSGLRGEPGPMQQGFDDDDVTQRILKTARLHAEEGLLRVGWMWVAGNHPAIGPVFFPLASMPVRTPTMHAASNMLSRVVRAGYKYADVIPAGDLELSEHVQDDAARDRLSTIPFGDSMFATMASPFVNPRTRRADPRSRQQTADLRKWAFEAARAAQVETSRLVRAEREPKQYLADSGLSIIVGVGLYVDEPEGSTQLITTGATLRSWAELDVSGSAFDRLYGDDDAESSPRRGRGAEPAPVASSLLLNPAQSDVVAASDRHRLTVVSGPPGTGKSQTVVAAAFHHVKQGRRVLVTAPTDAAVSALVALLEAAPGPDPVVFGASMRRLDVANRLGEGAGPWFDDRAVERAQAAARRSAAERDRLRGETAGLLAAEQAAQVDASTLILARQQAPGLFDVHADLFALRDLGAAASADGGWLARRRAGRAWNHLQRAARCDRALGVDRVRALVETAIARRQGADLEAGGGLQLDGTWEQLLAADDAARRHEGEALQASTHHDDRADRSSRRAIGAVAAALRAGRVKRREALAAVDGRQLTAALPLWVATLRDIDDLLPMQTDLFDVVIIDEASSVDQIGAAPALLRARSAMIVGDPRQLRHVSFLAEDRVLDALADNGLTNAPAASQLDIRRQTLFDAAAAAAPVVMLDEHYRSAPHLIAFSAERFYDGRLHIATRHPRNDVEDRIEVIQVDGTRSDKGVNHVEVDAVIGRLRSELEAGACSVGVLSPFRAQADALEAAVLDVFELSEIEALDLRVGTVHAFQGCQRDVVYISLTIDDESPRGSRAFLSEATLFNVMVTRAKERIHVVSSITAPDRGVLADYLRHAERPPSAGGDRRPARRWTELVRAELECVGRPLVVGYPSGRHVIDILLGEGAAAIAVMCGVHPDGADAHIVRHLDLLRAGWTIVEAFETRWGDRLAELVVELVQANDARTAGG